MKLEQETIQKIAKTSSWFFEKVNKIDKPLATLMKRRREEIQITRIHDGKGKTTIHIIEIHNIIRSSFENLYCNKIENIEDMINF